MTLNTTKRTVITSKKSAIKKKLFNSLINFIKGDHARQDSMEAWSKNGISEIPPPLERYLKITVI